MAQPQQRDYIVVITGSRYPVLPVSRGEAGSPGMAQRSGQPGILTFASTRSPTYRARVTPVLQPVHETPARSACS